MHKLRRAFAALLATLCLAVGALWIASYRLSDTAPADEGEFRSDRFFNEYSYGDEGPSTPVGLEFGYPIDDSNWFRALAAEGVLSVRLDTKLVGQIAPPQFRWEKGGFGFTRWTWLLGGTKFPRTQKGFFVLRKVHFPIWTLLMIVAAYPVLSFTRGPLRRRRRRRRGQCVVCGYDLSQSPERCPECGDGAE
ncbi:MAG TPA: hypothetical protein P5081_23265 [Phycisphaerae bacterium]|nr:hypothetical protein [Phycisphaerae bacterium]HRW55802.1 hypothetical protein [Phycisphaerae bacterium]